ncbi:MAG TPA: GIY-YIG nuclease family protein [Beijerinckiaceae bacterium]|nr:GIY-YIG nuclease family protein [Beijerinckiaceae bacterium]
MLERAYWVYMLSSKPNGTLYIGVTNDLGRRVYEHKTKAVRGFTADYDVSMLVWYESHADINEAIAREKMLKKWRRGWKIRLILEMNPEWDDLYQTLNH